LVATSTGPPAGIMFPSCAMVEGVLFPPAQKETCKMRQLRSFLRSAPSRVRRRLAEIVAIAAASLPTAGA
jgi:hypothetical protein